MRLSSSTVIVLLYLPSNGLDLFAFGVLESNFSHVPAFLNRKFSQDHCDTITIEVYLKQLFGVGVDFRQFERALHVAAYLVNYFRAGGIIPIKRQL